MAVKPKHTSKYSHLGHFTPDAVPTDDELMTAKGRGLAE